MNRRVFRSKIVYWISIIYFLTILYAVFKYLIQFYSTIEKEHVRYYINAFNFILVVIILFFLINKNSKSVISINIIIGFILLLAIFRIFNSFFYLGFFHEKLNSELFLVFLNIGYLFLVNYFKINKKVIVNSEEIDQIGNKNLEP